MASLCERLVRARDIRDLHRELRAVECSCQELNRALKSAKPRRREPWCDALLTFLKAFDAFRNEPVKTFEDLALPMAAWRQALDLRARYLTGRGYCLLGRHYWRLGNLAEAERYAGNAGAIADSISFPFLKAESQEILCRIKASACEWNLALSLADSALRLFTRNGGDLLGQSLAWEALGRAHFEQGDFASAHQALETSLALSKRCMDDFSQADTRLLRVHLCYHTRDYGRCKRLLDKTEALCRDLAYARGTATIERYRGKLLLHQGDWNAAIPCFRKSLDIFQGVGDPAGSARAYLSLARAYTEGGEWNLATDAYGQAEALFREVHDEIRLATALTTKGLLLARRERLPQAAGLKESVIRLFDESLQIYRRNGDRRHLASALYEMGEQYRRWGDFQQARKCFKDAIETASLMQAERFVERCKADEDWAGLVLEAKKAHADTILLLNSVCHDLNGEVARLHGFLDMMAEPKTSPEQIKTQGARAKCRAEYLGSICRGMMDLAKAEFGTFALDKKEVDLRDTVDKAFQIVNPDQVTCVNSVGEGLTVCADRDHLIRTLVNLLGNASKFTKKGSISVSASEVEKEGYVTVTITDTGYGIPREMRDKVFDLYAQAEDYSARGKESLSKTAERGYGIGLAYCKLAIESHGGTIWVDPRKTFRKGEDPGNKDRSGTVIHFTLPNAPARPQ